MRTIATTFTLVIAGAALTGCSGSSSTDAAGTDTADACDAGTFTAAVEQLLASQGGETKLISLDGFECDGDWAVTFPTIGISEEESYTYTQVFRADGGSWSPIEDRNTVCGTYDADDPMAYPSDSQVPESLDLLLASAA